MKNNRIRYTRRTIQAIQALVFASAAAHAATILPDTAGNVLIPSNYDELNGTDNTILASGGTAAPYVVTVQSGAILNATTGRAIDVTVANYTVNNSGSLSGSDEGIRSSVSLTVANSGIIEGLGQEGIETAGGSAVVNNGGAVIRGADDGVYFFSDGGTVTNYGTISGLTGLNSDGVDIGSGVLVDNYNRIEGFSNGIEAGANLTLTNYLGATVQGGADAGVEAGANALINNYASVASTSSAGAVLGNDGQINNRTTYDIFGNPSASGAVVGGSDGVSAGTGLQVINESLGRITGNGGDGIFAGSIASLTNGLSQSGYSAVISGTDQGVSTSGDALNVVNNLNGLIIGDSDDGSVGNGLDIGGNLGTSLSDGLTNRGAISGGENGILVVGNAFITNESGGRILGDTVLDSSGSILSTGGGAGNGITVNGNLTLQNFGLVDGADSGVTVGGLADITNSGTIRGDSLAISLLGGAGDMVKLLDGSTVSGSVLGGLGDTLAFTGGLTAPGDFTNNVVTGAVTLETVTKSGGGTAFINGAVTADAITINAAGGGLYINGNVGELTAGGAPTLIDHSGAGLGGTGTWTANVALHSGAGLSAGQIPINLTSSPTTAIGTLNLVGDVTHDSGSFLRYDVRPQAFTPVSGGSAGDLINHSGGTYALGAGATLRISPTDINQVLSDGTYTVVDSTNVITGSLPSLAIQYNANIADTGAFVGSEVGTTGTDTVLVDYFTSVARSLDNTNLLLVVDHDYAGLPGLSANESAVGAALDGSVNSSGLQDFIAALDNSNLLTVQETLAALNPEAYLGATTATINSNYRLHRLAQNHLASVRANGQRTMTTPASTDAKGAVIPAQTSTTGTRGNLWGTFSYDWQDYEGNGRGSDYDGNTWAFTAGFDWRVAPQLVLGVLLDGSSSDFDYDGGGGNETDSFRIAAYGTWGAPTGLYSDFLVGYGNHDYDLDRRVGGLLGGNRSGSTDADSIQAMVTVGYNLGDEKIQHGPWGGLEYQKVDVDGFTERGGALPVRIGDYDTDSLRALVGYRVEANLGTFRPYASAAYAHEFKDDRTSASASFGGASFHVKGAEQNSAILLGLGTGIAVNEALSFDIGYRGEISVDDEGLDSHGASLGVNWSF